MTSLIAGDTAIAPSTRAPRRFRRIVAASMAAALVFGDVFFKATGNPLDGVIAALLTYAVGFVARPIGGIVFGHYGDRFGRKKLLQVSLLMIGVSTFLIGALPGFDKSANARRFWLSFFALW